MDTDRPRRGRAWLWIVGIVVVLCGAFVIWGVTSQQAAQDREDRISQLVRVND